MLERNPAGQAQYCCIVLHGLGASGADLFTLAPDLWPHPSVRWIFPDAPMRPITINGGMAMRGWYDVRVPRLLEQEDTAGITASADEIRALIEAEVAQGIPHSHIVLAGFSQGGAMALHTGIRLDKPLAAIVGMSCYLPLPDTVGNQVNPVTMATPIFLAAGEHDPIISPHDTLASGQLLTELGFQVSAHIYAIEHSIAPQEVSDVASFLDCLNSNQPK